MWLIPSIISELLRTIGILVLEFNWMVFRQYPGLSAQLCIGMSFRHVLACRQLFSVHLLLLLPEMLVGLVERNREPPK